MNYTLGLDLGTNSLGWAIVDENNKKIIDLGVRIFPVGVKDLGLGEKEISLNAQRRGARQRRRQGFRRKLRKRHLMNALALNGMSPGNYNEFKSGAKHDEFAVWFQKNVYALRRKAVNEMITMMEIGRVLYHMAQRRGFQSNSRNALASEEKGGTIFSSSGDKPGIFDTRDQLVDKTLGTYLHSLYPAKNESYQGRIERIRNRYTTRQMYIDEFETIWNTQSQYHVQLNIELKTLLGGRKNKAIDPLLPNEARYKEDGILFFQRPLKSQRNKLGKCPFEQNKSRCPKSHPLFEEARVRQFLNNIRVDERPLVEQELTKAWNWLKLKHKEVKFSQLRKHLKLQDDYFSFNYNDDVRVPVAPSIAKLSGKDCFGEEWFRLSKEEQEKRWHIIYNADDVEWLYSYAQKEWLLNEKCAEHLSRKVHLADGYGSLSRKALTNIILFLKMGHAYDISVTLGGVVNAMGRDRWNELSLLLQEDLIAQLVELRNTEVKGGYLSPLKAYLENNFALSDKALSKLYHHSLINSQNGDALKLPTDAVANQAIQNLRNPIVITALFETRRLVNVLLKKHGPFKCIKIELGKDLKGNKEQRAQATRQNKSRNENRLRIIDILEKANIPVRHENILKFRLWEECKKTSPYSGKAISFEDLYNGKVEIEHIHPWSRSLNNSWNNKTLCETIINREKSNRTPFEYFSQHGNWEEAKKTALDLFKNSKDYPNRYKKFEQFAREKFNEDFTNRQMNDMRYASQEARKLLLAICPDVKVFPGILTSELRHFWGMNTLVDSNNREKDRTDHRHHAIDALTLSLTTPKHFQELSKHVKYGAQKPLTKNQVSEPWDGFRLHAKQFLEALLVSHKSEGKPVLERHVKFKGKNGNVYINRSRLAKGQLHKETFYGRRQSPGSTEKKYHIRKSLGEITTLSQVKKIVDDRIRAIILDHLSLGLGLDIAQSKLKLPKDAFLLKDENGTTQTKIHLPNKNGARVPVFKVRLKANLGNAVQIKDENQFVDPKNNHHCIIYETESGELQEEMVQFWHVVKRISDGDPPFQLPADGKHIIAKLIKGETFLLGLQYEELADIKSSELSQHLYRVQKVSRMYYTFRHHLASTLKFRDQEQSVRSFKKWKDLNPIQVKISIDGKIIAYDC